MQTIRQFVIVVKEDRMTWRDMLSKSIEYLRMGAVVINIDPATKSAIVYRDNELPKTYTSEQDLTVPDILPGFSVNVGSLFE